MTLEGVIAVFLYFGKVAFKIQRSGTLLLAILVLAGTTLGLVAYSKKDGVAYVVGIGKFVTVAPLDQARDGFANKLTELLAADAGGIHLHCSKHCEFDTKLRRTVCLSEMIASATDSTRGSRVLMCRCGTRSAFSW